MTPFSSYPPPHPSKLMYNLQIRPRVPGFGWRPREGMYTQPVINWVKSKSRDNGAGNLNPTRRHSCRNVMAGVNIGDVAVRRANWNLKIDTSSATVADLVAVHRDLTWRRTSSALGQLPQSVIFLSCFLIPWLGVFRKKSGEVEWRGKCLSIHSNRQMGS